MLNGPFALKLWNSINQIWVKFKFGFLNKMDQSKLSMIIYLLKIKRVLSQFKMKGPKTKGFLSGEYHTSVIFNNTIVISKSKKNLFSSNSTIYWIAEC